MDAQTRSLVVDNAKRVPKRQDPSWHQYIWMGAGAGLFFILLLLLGFVGVTVLKIMEIISTQQNADLGFVFSGVVLVNLTLLRLIALLIGGAIAFAGLAVSFFAHDKATSLSAQGKLSEEVSTGGALKTFSPGVVGVAVGAIIIMTSILSTATHRYFPPTVTFEYQNLEKTTKTDSLSNKEK
ncbi:MULTISPECIES: hypothetical protein [Pseudomonas]|uniref:hypothetical protein n=1 Tax=Pseudomonas sp. MIL9 TaxID=2807620 RepID=UPI00102A33FC|nr:hypothetical protein [Pseudomonas sp. MIL9]MBM6447343.1 hypothetical protein [Pseudomonas sp. MIL9]RZO06501.1 hypothetical protein EKG40_17840 [Pseudomonas moorei]